MTGRKLITLEKVSLVFRERMSFFRHRYHHALKELDFDVYRGETLGIIGGNGSGKSSVLKVICGIYQPDSGFVHRENVTASLQTLATGFDPELSGKDNAVISSMLLGHSKEAALESLDAINEMSELGESFYSPLKTYSSGMRARLGFSVAVTMHADVLLIDETLGVGDSKFKMKAESIIVDKIRSNQTVVFVSHSIGQVNRLCDRVIWLHQGAIKMVGETQRVTEAYLQFTKDLGKNKALK